VRGKLTNISFGTEFECDILLKQRGPYLILRESPNKYFTTGGWSYQYDQTCGTELRSPPFTNINNFLESCQEQFTKWIKANSNSNELYVPFNIGCPAILGNFGSHSMGNHIHIGLPNRDLHPVEKSNIAAAAIKYYPLLAGIGVNDCREGYASYRGMTTNFARRLSSRPVGSHHYDEISDNTGNGTVEFRLFDANLPQVVAAIIVLFRNIAKKAIDHNTHDIDYIRYKSERTRVLKEGIVALDINSYLNEFLSEFGDISLTNFPECIREVLYLAFVVKKSHGQLMKDIKDYIAPSVKGYALYLYVQYTMLTNTNKYFENFLGLKSVPDEFKERIRQWKEDAINYSSLQSFVGPIMFKYDRKLLWDEILTHIPPLVVNGKIREAKQKLLDGGVGKTYVNDVVLKIKKMLSINEDNINKIIKTSVPKRLWKDGTAWDIIARYKPEMLYLREVVDIEDLNAYKENIKTKIAHNEFTICRINEVPNTTSEEVAKTIAQFFVGHELFQDITYEYVLKAPERFYVFLIDNEICGCISIRVRSGMIKHLYVKRPARRCGIATHLIKFCMSVMRTEQPDCIIIGAKISKDVVVDEDTLISEYFDTISVFENLGFVRKEDNNNFYLLKNLREDNT